MASKEIFTKGPKQPWGVHESYREAHENLEIRFGKS